LVFLVPRGLDLATGFFREKGGTVYDSPHEVFEKDVGTWDAEVVVRPSPGAAEQRSRGVMTSERVCGGKWLMTHFKNETSGFEGHGLYGFDTQKLQYTGTWVDDQRTFLAVGQGTWDEEARTMTYRYEVELPGRTLKWREITFRQDEGTHLFRSMFTGPDGVEFEMMTVTYRRRPAEPQMSK
jgi:hypothetical protein